MSLALPPPSTPPPLRHDDVDLEPDELGRQIWQPLQLALSKTGLVYDVLALDVAEPSQRFTEYARRGTVGRSPRRRKVTDAKDLLGRLRRRREGRSEHAQSQGNDKRTSRGEQPGTRMRSATKHKLSSDR
jgi:hypothetical protein